MIRAVTIVLGLVAFSCVFASDRQQTSRSTFAKLMDVQELWEEEDYPKALQVLEALIEKTGKDSYDYAVVNQYLAHTCVLADCPARSRTALEAAFLVPDLPKEFLADIKLFYAQIVIADEEFELARVNFEDWLRLTEEKPKPSPLFSAAYANFSTEHYARADELLLQAFESHRATPPDSWYRLRYETLYKLKRFVDAEQIALDLVARSPGNADYWRLLANHHLRREQGPMALAIMTIAYQQGLLDDPGDLRRIITLYSFVEVPERAARLLDTFIADAVFESDFDTLKQLGELWLVSRERDRAIAVLNKATAVAPDGETDVLLGSIYFEDENWEEAHAAFRRAIDRGAAEENERIHLLAGISALRAGMEDEARTALREALKSHELRSQARSFLKQLDAGDTSKNAG